LIRQNRRELLNLLFGAASKTVLEFGQNRFGVALGVRAVLHTWSQTLLDHYHLHLVVSGGGLSADGQRWVSAPAHYLFSVHALGRVFRAKFRDGLGQLHAEGRLALHGQLEPLTRPPGFQRLVAQATRRCWNVYVKRPFAGPAQVLAYLSRYTHRVAISPRRLLDWDPDKQTVTFGYKDYADGCRRKTMTLDWGEFLRRFCLHLLPRRFVKIRHYGLLGNRNRHQRLERARELLGVGPAQDPTPQGEICLAPAAPLGQPTPKLRCPHCGATALELIQILPPGHAPPMDSS
jgi:hypothetical protein